MGCPFLRLHRVAAGDSPKPARLLAGPARPRRGERGELKPGALHVRCIVLMERARCRAGEESTAFQRGEGNVRGIALAPRACLG